MHKYGITREQMSAVPLVQRENAALNPNALYRDPLTYDDYMGARMISTPFCLYDCDVPCDGATAMIISRIDLARDMPNKLVRFEAVGGGARQGIDRWIGRNDFPHMMMHDAAQMMWSRTDMTPTDVDTAHLYDGFTYFVLFWLEALGFCKEGESGAFVEGGTRISRGGDLPINSNGGQLSEGRTHGFGHLYEALLQLRGQAGDRQVEGAKVAVTGVGGGALGGCLLLTNQD
jgi:acetyl-CoA acetyltransferase